MKRRTMKALVTGGAGFIGSHLCDELLSRGFFVTAVDNLSTGSKANIADLIKANHHFKFHKGSIMDEKLMEYLIKECDIIYHLAAVVGVKLILNKPIDSILTNIKGTEIVLKLAEKHRKKVLIASSSEVYGKHACYPLHEESDQIVGASNISRWSYSNAKAADEFLALAYAKEKKLLVVIARLFNTVGPRQVGAYGMVLPKFIEQALSGKPITIYGNGKQIRSFTYVKDAVRTIVDLTLKKKAEGQIFNIGSEEHISIKGLANRIKKKTHSKSFLRHVSYQKAYGDDFEDAPCRICDLTKIKKVIGYRPRYTLDDIIDNTITYFKAKLNK